MSIIITKSEDQSRGYFDSGKVKERKPVSFDSPVKGISTLYSWSYVCSEEGGVIEEHAHKGFEIITYVVEGMLEYQEEGEDEWTEIKTGDLHIMRAGNGATHQERYAPNTRTHQIWLDPDFRRSLQRPSASVHYEAEDFPAEEKGGMQMIDFLGDEAPAYFATTNMRMERYDFEAGAYSIPLESGHIITAVVLDGEIGVDEETMEVGDVVQIKGRGEFAFKGNGKGALLVICNALQAGYRTYNDQLQM